MAGVLLLDRLHKYIQIETLGWRGGEYVQVAPIFDYVLVWNTGVSYGLLTGIPIPVLLGIMGFAIALLIVWWVRSETRLTAFGLAVILGGAISHIIDRFIYGAVPDFFHFHWNQFSFYVFNISDVAITLGVVLLLLDTQRPEKKENS